MMQVRWLDEQLADAQTSRLEALGSAAAGIAHDLNNELTLVLNHLAMTDVDSARAAAVRCSALTASILSYCRGEDLVLQRLNPVEFLRGFAEGLALPASLKIHLELPAALPAILANPNALARVLTNLMLNSRHAMGDSGSIIVRALEGVIQIEDSGPGIPPENIKRIFEPFFSTKRDKAGTGLGLAIVREIMRQQGGSVRARPGSGGGACFELQFRK